MESHVVSYRNKLTGCHFNNGTGGQNDYTSKEIHAAEDKRAIGNDEIMALRAAFAGKITG